MTTPRRHRPREAASPARPVFALLLSAGLALAASPAVEASPIVGILDYQGFAYESLPFGTPGSVLTGMGTVDTWFLPLNDPGHFYTWVMEDLVGQGAVPVGCGSSSVDYAGGSFTIYQDTADNTVYDLTPGNGTPDPFGFDDGSVWLVGHFTSFQYFWNAPASLGAYSGDIFITGGTGAAYFPDDIAFTFGGTTNQSFLPEGYSVKADGAVEGPVIPEPSSGLLTGSPLIVGWLANRLRSRKNRG